MKIQPTSDLEAEMRKIARGEITAPADAALPSVNYLHKAWREGLESGDAGELDFEVLKQDARALLTAAKKPTEVLATSVNLEQLHEIGASDE